MIQNQAAESNGLKPPFTSKNGINFRCPKCAGALKYDIREGKLRCEQCSQLLPVGELPDPVAEAGGGHRDIPGAEMLSRFRSQKR